MFQWSLPTRRIYPNVSNRRDLENQQQPDQPQNVIWKGSEFPLFDKITTLDYHQHNMKVLNPVYYIPIILSYPFVITMLCNIQGTSNDPWSVLCIILVGTGYLVFNVSMVPHILSFFPKRKDLRERMMVTMNKYWFSPEDFCLVDGIIVLCFYLIRRILVGQCPTGTTLYGLQSCNYFSAGHGIPSDLLVFLYLLPISLQIVLKNLSLFALCISWFFVIVTVIFCLVFTSAWTDTLTLCLIVIPMVISFELERLQRIAYMQLTTSQWYEKQATLRAEERLLVEQQLMSEKNEKKLQISETFQLRSLMGNVVRDARRMDLFLFCDSIISHVQSFVSIYVQAHDLKTPLVAFNGDVDILKLYFAALSKEAIRDATAKLRTNGGAEIKPREIFRSLWSTSHFMLAAINRGQDYMKATNGVKLVPSNGTFELANTLKMVAQCTKQLFTEGRHLILHPLPTIGFCPCIVSDSHWLLENLLCLISNAVKYSDDGDCDVRIALVSVVDVMNMSIVREDSVVAVRSPLSTKRTSTKCSQEITHHIRITVEDHGIGIEESARSSMFGLFRQAQRSAGGTGLGLFRLGCIYKTITVIME